MNNVKWMYFLSEEDELLKNIILFWDKVSADIKKSLIASMSAKKNFQKQKENLTAMK